jgi:hypothetical protein
MVLFRLRSLTISISFYHKIIMALESILRYLYCLKRQFLLFGFMSFAILLIHWVAHLFHWEAEFQINYFAGCAISFLFIIPLLPFMKNAPEEEISLEAFYKEAETHAYYHEIPKDILLNQIKKYLTIILIIIFIIGLCFFYHTCGL